MAKQDMFLKSKDVAQILDCSPDDVYERDWEKTPNPLNALAPQERTRTILYDSPVRYRTSKNLEQYATSARERRDSRAKPMT
jgi:hypothetical protein